MAKTRPGIERITKQHLRAQHAKAIMDLHRHLGHCLTCKRAGNDLLARCTAWWHLAKTEHRLARALRQFNTPEVQGMDPLPGME